jgi:hypothetical protein
MNAMWMHGRRGFVAAGIAIAAILLLIGLAMAANGNGGSSQDGPPAAADPTPSATLTATSTQPVSTARPSTPTPVPPTPSSPDTPVQSPPAAATPSSPAPTPTRPAGSSTLPLSDLPTLPAGTQRVDAPIDGLDILILESFPPQYMLHIQAGLPSGCAKQAGYEASRFGSVITVRVYNSIPTGQVACTMIYGTYELNLNLGSDYTPGQTYTVRVNDETTTFTAQ